MKPESGARRIPLAGAGLSGDNHRAVRQLVAAQERGACFSAEALGKYLLIRNASAMVKDAEEAGDVSRCLGMGLAVVKLSQLRSIEDIVTRLRENWVGFVHEYRVWLILVLLTSLADMASTMHFMLYAGPQAELHPTVRFLSEYLGPFLGPFLGKAIQVIVLIVVTVFLRRWAVFIFLPVIILYGWAAWYNVWGYQLYYPRLLHLLEHLVI